MKAEKSFFVKFQLAITVSRNCAQSDGKSRSYFYLTFFWKTNKAQRKATCWVKNQKEKKWPSFGLCFYGKQDTIGRKCETICHLSSTKCNKKHARRVK